MIVIILAFILSFPLTFLFLGMFGMIAQAWPLFLGLGLAGMFLNHRKHQDRG